MANVSFLPEGTSLMDHVAKGGVGGAVGVGHRSFLGWFGACIRPHGTVLLTRAVRFLSNYCITFNLNDPSGRSYGVGPVGEGLSGAGQYAMQLWDIKTRSKRQAGHFTVKEITNSSQGPAAR